MTAIISISVSVVAGVISALILRRITKMDAKQERREATHIKQLTLIMQGVQAIGHLAEATANAVLDEGIDGKPGSPLDTAQKYYYKWNDEQHNAYMETAATAAVKGN